MTKGFKRNVRTIRVDVCTKYAAYTREELVNLIEKSETDAINDGAIGDVLFEVEHEEYHEPYDTHPTHQAKLQMYYSRLENDAECAARVEAEEKRNREQEARERAEFERLSKRFNK